MASVIERYPLPEIPTGELLLPPEKQFAEPIAAKVASMSSHASFMLQF